MKVSQLKEFPFRFGNMFVTSKKLYVVSESSRGRWIAHSLDKESLAILTNFTDPINSEIISSFWAANPNSPESVACSHLP